MSTQPPTPTHAENRLAHEASAYLRQHAHNPVDWYPWSREALDRARTEQKPILLSVGYSACHWCHVMAHESFENPEIAARMNANFINIKLDREERPDLDQLYQGVVQLLGRGGGWPLTVFLTPELEPFYGGTYFPPEDRHGLPAFPRLLDALADAWTHQREAVKAQTREFMDGLTQLSAYGLDAAPGTLTEQDVVDAARALAARTDPVNGGFGTAPKFPNPMNVALLLRGWRRSGDEAVLEAAEKTLLHMAQGGVYDQLGGGFHRYSVDAHWKVPHFEKMLYDNALLLHLYAEAFQVRADPLWREIAEETVAWLQREMTDAGGGFHASQDADTEGEEGRFFVWSLADVERVLPEALRALAYAHYGVTAEGNFEGGRTVLSVVRTAEQLAAERSEPVEQVQVQLDQVQRLLLAERERRVRPGRDDKKLAGWNGLMIRALAFASRVFDRPDWLVLAKDAAEWAIATLWRDGRLARLHEPGHARQEGMLEDYGDLAAGLIALYEAGFELRHLEVADAIVEAAYEHFWDEEKQAWRSAPKAQGDLVCPTYALFDNAWPSGASTLTEAQVKLAALTGRNALLERAERYLSRMRDELVKNPMGYGYLWLAADSWLEGAASVVVAGEGISAAELLGAIADVYCPHVVVDLLRPGVSHPLTAAVHEGKGPRNGQAAAYLCRSFSCEAPITGPRELKERLRPAANALPGSPPSEHVRGPP